MEREERYLVLKKSDLKKYLSEEWLTDLARIESCIDASRINDQKQLLRCVVVDATNVDEATFLTIEAIALAGEEIPQCPE